MGNPDDRYEVEPKNIHRVCGYVAGSPGCEAAHPEYAAALAGARAVWEDSRWEREARTEFLDAAIRDLGLPDEIAAGLNREDPLLAAAERSPADSTKDRHDGTWERSRRKGLYRRLRLRRADGRIYLDRWGIGHDRVGRVLIHRMSAPDPGIDLHDHPWTFLTIPLWGGYIEQRASIRIAVELAEAAERDPDPGTLETNVDRGIVEVRRPFRPRRMRLDECHTIIKLRRRTAWSLVIGGPRVRRWGFYTPMGYMDERVYDETVRADRRDLWGEVGASGPKPWKDA